MAENRARRLRVGSVALIVLSVATSFGAAALFARLLWLDGGQWLDVIFLAIFAVLFLWINVGFWTATFGFVWQVFGNRPRPVEARSIPDAPVGARVAIVMPIHNEDPVNVFANLEAIHESLQKTGRAPEFDIFVLSDTTHPDIWIREEQEWERFKLAEHNGCGLFYRRRPTNTARKSGNIADFCARWGKAYRYMIVLDADSLMSGDTLVEMVRRMENDPEIGILQVPPVPIGRISLFARIRQFAASLYGHVFTCGYALWTQSQGNYFGHNAILRVEPFMECCGLPLLPGQPPLGGEILSHDFVEAALLQRRGWKVVVVGDLGGSYEECPATLAEFARRDQRWCQGNLQHLRLTVIHGLAPVSRINLGIGVMSYLSAPLWALFMILALLVGGAHHKVQQVAPDATSSSESATVLSLALILATFAMLFLPKLWACLVVLSRPKTTREYGGAARLVAGALIETVVSALLAPVFMAFHTTFVAQTFLGLSVEWEAYPRGEQTFSFLRASRLHSTHTIAGLTALLITQWLVPDLLLWMLPVLAGLVLSIPLTFALSSVRAGRGARNLGLFATPEEIHPPPVVHSQRTHLEQNRERDRRRPEPFTCLALDPALNRLHIDMLPDGGTRSDADRQSLKQLCRVAVAAGPQRLTPAERMALATDAESVRALHEGAWKEWPLELLAKAAPEECS